jgi:hypothetical protein
MLPLEPYLTAARGLTRALFVARHPGYFLIKRPSDAPQSEQRASEFNFATVAGKLEIDPFASHWRIVPVAKRPDNPFPERMTVGRAPNCDIVLRIPFVSKVHAHIMLHPDGSHSLHDNHPSNPTLHNSRTLEPGSTTPLAVKDRVGFGSLEVEFVDAARLYDILRDEAT